VLANPVVSAFFRGPDQGQTGQVGGTEKNKNMSESTNINLADFKIHDTDTGSADYQVALMTQRIVHLTAHLGLHKKDTSSRRGLLKLVAQRRKLLDYVRANSEERYQKLLAGLNLRK
jgi:small subunit ribosomal protein S15